MVNPSQQRRQSGQRLEAFRRQREIHNSQSLFVKLPPELRNKIYWLALPHGQLLNTGSAATVHYFDFDSGSTVGCATIQRRKSYRRHFAVTEVCRQLRNDTVKLLYSNNTFLLRTVSLNEHNTPITPATIGNATAWIMSRSPEALQAISRIALQFWDTSDNGSTQGTMITVFDLKKRTTEHIRLRPPRHAIRSAMLRYAELYTGLDFGKVFTKADKKAIEKDRRLWLRALVEAFSDEMKTHPYRCSM